MTFEIPEDFDRFWQEAVEEAESLPLRFERKSQRDQELPGFIVERVEFNSLGSRTLHGWLAYEAGAWGFPAFVWVPPYGFESLLPNQYGTRHGFTSLSFNFFGHDAFFQQKYVPGQGYFAEGAELPETWAFRRMFQDAVIATRVLQSLPEADAGRVGAMGMSQGGGISIWLGAWMQSVRAVCADMPFLGNIGQTLEGNVYRYPLKELIDLMEALPLGRERIQNTVSYFDTAFHASRCKKPTQVSLGLKDPAARPEQVRAIYGALPAEKRLITYEIGHDWAPEMVENNSDWMRQHLR
ncbi:MAG TPA: acetylxylan esterase [Fimbriimonas sp.]|nr:acetylxylan esterase [Fimbriimonas sp.]